jgi:hypothetical protein
MAPLGRATRSVLPGFHVLFASAWMGGVAALILVSVGRALGFSVVQAALLVFMLFLSTIKPFAKRGGGGRSA